MKNIYEIYEASLLDIEDTLSTGDEIFKNLEVDLKNINKGLNIQQLGMKSSIIMEVV